VTHCAVLEHAIVLLMRAAESGRAKDRAAATERPLDMSVMNGFGR